jgi:NADH-quinone oxidoreductase subunit M
VAILAAPSIALSAAYILRALQSTFFGELNRERYPHVGDVTVLDKVAIVTLAVWFVLIGVFPRVMTDLIQTGVEPIAALLHGAMLASLR